MYCDVFKKEPQKRKEAWGLKECEACEIARKAIKFINLHLRRCGKSNLCISPVFMEIDEGHLVEVALFSRDGYVWLRTIHGYTSVGAFMRGMWRMLKEIFEMRNAFFVDGIPKVYDNFGHIYQFEFLHDKIALNVVEAQRGLVCRVEGLEETIGFLINFFVMLKTIEEVNEV